ncbi:zf-CCHC domain-containing protein [Tanacetum coccineum]
MLSNNNEAKMVLYNALPKKEYKRVFMHKTAKYSWNSLVITHKGNKQVKDNNQQYEHLLISDDESINNAFARFNTKITSLKALDESSSSRNHVRKFLRALPTKWRPKVYKLLLEKDYEASKNKKERYKSLALKANKELSDKETSTSGSEDEEYAMAVRDFKKLFRRRGRFVRQPNDDKKAFGKVKEYKKINSDRKCFKCGDLNHFISDCPKHSHSDQKEFVGGL